MAEWKGVEGTKDIQTYEYSFGHGLARTFAVLGPKGWVVVGAAAGADEPVYAALEKRGPVAAIVAPNAFHTMGVKPWHERFPSAKVFAPAQAIARVTKKSGVEGIAPVADAGEVCGDAVELLDMPHYKSGELLVVAPSSRGPVWHVTDVIFNWPTVPPGFIVKLFFTVLTDSAPGFKLSGLSAMFAMRDKRGVYRWLKELAEKAPPARIVPSHGVDEVLDPPGEKLLEILAQQGKV